MVKHGLGDPYCRRTYHRGDLRQSDRCPFANVQNVQYAVKKLNEGVPEIETQGESEDGLTLL